MHDQIMKITIKTVYFSVNIVRETKLMQKMASSWRCRYWDETKIPTIIEECGSRLLILNKIQLNSYGIRSEVEYMDISSQFLS